MSRLIAPYLEAGDTLDTSQQTFLESVETVSAGLTSGNLRDECIGTVHLALSNDPIYEYVGRMQHTGPTYTHSGTTYTLVDQGSNPAKKSSINKTLNEGDVLELTASVLCGEPTLGNYTTDEYAFRFYITYNTSTTTAIGPHFVYSMQRAFNPVTTNTDRIDHQRVLARWVYIHTGSSITLNSAELRCVLFHTSNDIDLAMFNLDVKISYH